MDQMIGMALGLVVIGAALVPGALGQTGSGRFPQLTKEALNEDQQRAAAEILKQSTSGLGGPWNVMLRSPEMADRLAKLLDYIRFKTSLPLRLNEFAIMITARHWSSQYEWWAHYRLAKEAGLSEEVMADLAQGKRPETMQPDEAIVYDFCTELHRTHFVSDATFKKAKDMLGEQPLVDLMAVSGAYTLVSMLLNTAEVMPKDGSRPLPPLGNR
ncbi:MAG: carboxymuconolactone decarboxylase family protein [Thermodesulfobacteriota bacterium]|jgi:4-carboxymuconolactone decarboxylase